MGIPGRAESQFEKGLDYPQLPLGVGPCPDTSPPFGEQGLTSYLLLPTFPPNKGPIRCQLSFPGIRIQPVASGEERWGHGSQAGDPFNALGINLEAYLPTPQCFRVSASASCPGRLPPSPLPTNLLNTPPMERTTSIPPPQRSPPPHPHRSQLPDLWQIISQAAFTLLK